MTKPAIAERRLLSARYPDQVLIVTLAGPEHNVVHDNYECAYEIVGSGLNINRRAVGLDGFQALKAAFVMIRAEIDSIEQELGLELRFGGLEDSGF